MKLIKAILLFLLAAVIGGFMNYLESIIKPEWIDFDYSAGLFIGFVIWPPMICYWDEYWLERRLKKLEQEYHARKAL